MVGQHGRVSGKMAGGAPVHHDEESGQPGAALLPIRMEQPAAGQSLPEQKGQQVLVQQQPQSLQ